MANGCVGEFHFHVNDLEVVNSNEAVVNHGFGALGVS